MSAPTIQVDLLRFDELLELTGVRLLTDPEREELRQSRRALAVLAQELERKDLSIRRLQRIKFGASTEKTSDVLGDRSDAPAAAVPQAGDGDGAAAAAGSPPPGSGTDPPRKRSKRKGHGRNGADAYPGAQRQHVDHDTLKPGERCPACGKGKVYPLPKPRVLVRITGQAPLPARVITCQRFRCNACGEVFTARAPPDTPAAKYDDRAAAMIGMLKYGSGMPFNRLARLQRAMGVPMPPATQWHLVNAAADTIEIVFRELVRQAAQGEVVHNDDTPAIILQLVGKRRAKALREQGATDERTGLFTTGIVSVRQGVRIAVFFTGKRHAGENLARVLEKRAAELGRPIQMCDALSRNMPGSFATLLANCLIHGRRYFVDVVPSFPDECRFVIEKLGQVFHNDDIARQRGMDKHQRLAWHRAESGPLMAELKKWMRDQLRQHRVEPNSGLGEAIAYMQKHWRKMVLFLRVPGAPLHNNICERALKKAILHRKNALFYKSERGALVGDIFMSLIHTAELCHVDPFDYLVALLEHAEAIAQQPARWMPWNYREELAGLAAAA